MSNAIVTRRQALRLALAGGAMLASTAVALSGPLASTLFAQQSVPLPVLGIRNGPVPTTVSAGPTSGGLAIPLLLQSLDLLTGLIQTPPIPQVLPNGTPILHANEVLGGFTTLLDGTLVLAIYPASGVANETSPPRLTLLGASPVALTVSGLDPDQQLGDLVGTNDGRLLGLVMKRNGTPPVSVVDVDLKTGALGLVNNVHLRQARRFRTLTQCPDGTLYTTAVERGGNTILVQLQLGQNKATDVVDLSADGTPWNNGLASLMCSGGSQPALLALGAPRYVSPNAVYKVDPGSGVMTRLQDFDTAKATVGRA